MKNESSKLPQKPPFCKTDVGSSALQLGSIGNVWCVFDKNGSPNEHTISHSKPSSIKKLLKVWDMKSKFSKWRYWKSKGWQCIKVDIQFTPSTPKLSNQVEHITRENHLNSDNINLINKIVKQVNKKL